MIKSDYIKLDELAIGELVDRRLGADLKICAVIKAARISAAYGYRIESGKDVPALAVERYKKALERLAQERAAI